MKSTNQSGAFLSQTLNESIDDLKMLKKYNNEIETLKNMKNFIYEKKSITAFEFR